MFSLPASVKTIFYGFKSKCKYPSLWKSSIKLKNLINIIANMESDIFDFYPQASSELPCSDIAI
jgi:hypothetical protein